MARKTLGKIEFQELVNSLKEQNTQQVNAQKDTTASLRKLHAYFLKKDRATMRQKLEAALEERNAEKVEKTKEKSGPKGKNLFDKKIPNKGLFGSFMNFMMTGALGSAGAGIFKGLWNSFKWGSGTGMKLARFAGAAILVPSLWNALSKAFEQKDFKNGINTFVSEFFGNGDDVAKPFGEKIGDAAGKGALLGFAVGGVQGMILGGLIGAAIVALPKVFENDKIKPTEMYEKVKTYMQSTFFNTEGKTGAVVGGFLGSIIGKNFGPAGMIAGALLGSGIGFLGGTLVRAVEIKENEQISLGKAFQKAMLEQILKNKTLSMGLFGMGIGAAVGTFTPVGMLGGAIIGAAIGAVTGAIADELEEGGFGYAVRNSFRRMRRAWEEFTSGNVEQARRILKGEVAVDLPGLEKQYKEGKMNQADYLSSKASILGVDAELLEPLNDALDNLRNFDEESKNRVFKLTGRGERTPAVKKLRENYSLIAKQKGKDPNKYDAEIAKIASQMTKFGTVYDTHLEDKDQAEALQFLMQGKEIERDSLQRVVDYVAKQVDKKIMSKVIKPGAETPKRLAVYNDEIIKPAVQRDNLLSKDTREYEMWKNDLLQSVRESRGSMAPGGVSSPVFNNTYTYTNQENVVREQPTTSGINMKTNLVP